LAGKVGKGAKQCIDSPQETSTRSDYVKMEGKKKKKRTQRGKD